MDDMTNPLHTALLPYAPMIPGLLAHSYDLTLHQGRLLDGTVPEWEDLSSELTRDFGKIFEYQLKGNAAIQPYTGTTLDAVVGGIAFDVKMKNWQSSSAVSLTKLQGESPALVIFYNPWTGRFRANAGTPASVVSIAPRGNAYDLSSCNASMLSLLCEGQFIAGRRLE